MSAPAYQPAAQTIIKWLKANGQSLGVLTGTDARALRAAAQLVELYSYCREEAVVQAFGTVVRQMQPSARYLAFHAIAHVLDWGDRPKLWALAGLEPLGSIPACTYGPGGKGGGL